MTMLVQNEVMIGNCKMYTKNRESGFYQNTRFFISANIKFREYGKVCKIKCLPNFWKAPLAKLNEHDY